MKPKLIAFDIEGTLTQGLVWQKLHEVAGVTPQEDQLWLTQYYEREISFEKWAELIKNKYLKSGKKRSEFERLMQKAEFLPGAKTTLRKLKKKYPLLLVSSAVDVFVQHVAEQIGIEEHHANYSFKYDLTETLVNITYHAPEDKAKVMFLEKICLEKNLKPQEIVFVGDSSNDLGAFSFTKHGILVGEGNEKLRRAAWKQIKSIKELEKILL